MSKRIYFILPILNGGGAERVTLNYIKQFKDEKNFEVSLILFNKDDSQLDLIPQFVNIIDLQTKSTKKSFFTLLREVNFRKSDIVFSTHSRVAVLLCLIKFFKSFIHIARMQNTPSLEIKYKKFSFLKVFLYKKAFGFASKVVAQTDDMKKDAKIVFSLKDSQVVVLNNPLDKENINAKILMNNSPFTQDEIPIVMSGRLHKNKAYDLVLKALSIVVEKYPNFKLYILGYDEGEKSKLENMITSFNLIGNVVFCGYTNNPYIYYNNAKLFILSSVIEGFPNTLLENYYLNTPLVSTKCIPIIEKLINEGRNGYTVAVGDVEDMACKIILALENLDRKNIQNNMYDGSNLPKFLRENY
jgi:glycosyltransferase involved in cell wall biosynthesis